MTRDEMIKLVLDEFGGNEQLMEIAANAARYKPLEEYEPGNVDDFLEIVAYLVEENQSLRQRHLMHIV
jgi:hypothetical protein